MPIVAVIVAASWWVFILFWLAMAWGTKRNDYRQPLGQRLAYFLPILIGAWLLAGFPRALGPADAARRTDRADPSGDRL